MSDQVTALQLALLQAPVMYEQAQDLLTCTTLPAGTTGGYSVAGALTALVQVSLREIGSRRRARIALGTVDLSATYTLDFVDTARSISASDAYNAGSGTPADVEELIEQWVASINADTDTAAVVTAQVDPDDPEVLLITWDDFVATGIELTVTGSAVATVTTEYEGATCILIERAAPRVAVETTRAASVAAWESWARMTGFAGFDGSFTLTQGTGIRVTVPCAGRAALLPYIPAGTLTGHADDGTTSGAVTMAYVAPVGLVAPGVTA